MAEGFPAVSSFVIRDLVLGNLVEHTAASGSRHTAGNEQDIGPVVA
jgi:hypothetical protein